MRFSACIAAACAASVLGFPSAAFAGDAKRGEDLYSQRCHECHTESVHGRVKRSATDFAAIRGWVRHWNESLKIGWGSEEVEDVTTYLNAAYYHFAPPAATTSLPAPQLAFNARPLHQVFPPSRW
jgi:mono/diheme cytochrome c family protein